MADTVEVFNFTHNRDSQRLKNTSKPERGDTLDLRHVWGFTLIRGGRQAAAYNPNITLQDYNAGSQGSRGTFTTGLGPV